MRYFVFLCLLMFRANDVMAQLDIRVVEDIKPQIDDLSVQPEKDIQEDFNSQVFKRNIYGRYDTSKKKISVENKISETILHPRKDFRDRIRDSLGKY